MNKNIKNYVLFVGLCIAIIYNSTAQKIKPKDKAKRDISDIVVLKSDVQNKKKKALPLGLMAFIGSVQASDGVSSGEGVQINSGLGFDVGNYFLRESNLIKVEPNINVIFLGNIHSFRTGTGLFGGLNIGIDYFHFIYKYELMDSYSYIGLGWEIPINDIDITLQYYGTKEGLTIDIFSIGLRYTL